MDNKEFVILAAKGPGGGSVTPESIVTATSQMTTQQAADTRQNIGAEPEKFIITVTESSGTYSADKTFAEIKAANDAGKTVIFGYGLAFAVAFVLSNQADANLAFIDDGTPVELRLVMAANNTITATRKELQEAGLIPAATSADEGKSVMVDENGNYTLGRAGGETVLTAKITTLSPVTCTMKPSEIKNALGAGTWVRALYQTKFEIFTGTINVNMRNTGTYPNEVMLNFVIRGGTPNAPKKVTVLRFIGDYNNDTWTYEYIAVVES